METHVKRAILATALLLVGTFAAQADVNVWSSVAKHDELEAANNACDARFGAPQNGVPVSAAYKRCMAQHGWRYVRTNRIQTWRDPDAGVCHNEGGATICCWPCRDGG
jgi:hypothetical protein